HSILPIGGAKGPGTVHGAPKVGPENGEGKPMAAQRSQNNAPRKPAAPDPDRISGYRAPGHGPVPPQLQEIYCEGASIVIQLPPEIGNLPPVLVPYQGTRFVPERHTRGDHPMKHVEVTTAAGRGPH